MQAIKAFDCVSQDKTGLRFKTNIQSGSCRLPGVAFVSPIHCVIEHCSVFLYARYGRKKQTLWPSKLTFRLRPYKLTIAVIVINGSNFGPSADSLLREAEKPKAAIPLTTLSLDVHVIRL